MTTKADQRRRLGWYGSLVLGLLLPLSLVAAEDRAQWQQPDRVMQDLNLTTHACVADIGCGSGYFTFRLAQAVGPQGKVLAVDVSDKALMPVRQRIEQEHLTNIEVVVSASRDAKLAAASVDAALLCNMLHDVDASDRLPLLQSAVRAIKPGGKLFLIDFARGRGVKVHPDEKLLSREDLLKLFTEAGLVLDAEFHYLKQQVFLRFRKPTGELSPPTKPQVLDVWPGKAPGEKGDVGEDQAVPSSKEAQPVKRVTNVTRPTITVFRPADQTTGTAVLICPGGGYNHLAFDKEGEEVAAWLNTLGVTGIVLKYRVPPRKDQPRHLAPLQDAQRAMSLVREYAAEWKLDPQRIGILGFSAGGHLAAATATNHDQRQYEALDDTDKLGCRPDFAVLVYPAYLTGGERLTPEIRVDERTPPCFFVHATNDRISPENSLKMYSALRNAKVPAEMHVYVTGGHGFGLRPSSNPCSTWPQRCEQWMNSQGLLGGR